MKAPLFLFFSGIPFLLTHGVALSFSQGSDVIRGNVTINPDDHHWESGELMGELGFEYDYGNPPCPPVRYRLWILNGDLHADTFDENCQFQSECKVEMWGGFSEWKWTPTGMVHDHSEMWRQGRHFNLECDNPWWDKEYWQFGIELPSGEEWIVIDDTRRVWGVSKNCATGMSGPLEETLDDIDTIQDAVARAGGPKNEPRPFYYGVAFPLEWSGTAFNKQKVDFRYEIGGLECGVEYEIIHKFEKMPFGGLEWEPFEEAYTIFNTDCVYEGSGSIPQLGDGCAGYYTRLVAVVAEKRSERGPVDLVACGGCGSGGCMTPGDGDGGTDGLLWYFSMGAMDHGKPAGAIWIREDGLTPVVLTPEALRYRSPSDGVEVVLDQNDHLRQVFAPQALANIEVVSDSEYRIDFYHPWDVGAPDGNGIYSVHENDRFTRWRIRNPDAGQSIFERLEIIRERDSSTQVNEFKLEISGNVETWTLARGQGLRVVEVTKTPLSATVLEKTTVVKNDSNEVAFAQTETFEEFPFGVRRTEKVTAAGTTAWYYYTDELNDGSNYGHVMLTTRPDGSWERYEYDDFGVRAKTISPYLDSDSTSTNENEHRVVEINRETVDWNSDGHLDDVTTRIERVEGNEVARSFSFRWGKPVEVGGESFRSSWEVQVVSAGGWWGDSANQVVRTLHYADGDWVGKIRSVLRPDSTATLYSYEMDPVLPGLRRIRETGAAVLTAGGELLELDPSQRITRVETVVGEFGEVFLRTTTDAGTGIVVAEDFSDPVDDFDEFRRVKKITHLDSSTTLRQYSCCSLLAETDREGITTVFGHDDLGRVNSRSRAGISHEYELDAMDRRVKTTRIGTDNSEIVQNVSVYDTAGRLTSSTDAVNNETIYSETLDGNGMFVRTTTFADNTQRIEKRWPDGSMKSLTGDAVHPVEYEYDVVYEWSGYFNAIVTKEIRMERDSEGNPVPTDEWVKRYEDMLGRVYKIEYADSAEERYVYNNLGQLILHEDPDGVRTLYGYNPLGEREYTVIDVGQNIDENDWSIGGIQTGEARITRTVREFLLASHPENSRQTDILRTRTLGWPQDGSSATQWILTVEESVDGLETWTRERHFSRVTHEKTDFPDPGIRRVTTTQTDLTVLVRVYENGRLVEEKLYPSSSQGTPDDSTAYHYDVHGRLEKTLDRQGNETVYTYFDNDLVESVTLPDPLLGGSNPGPVTTYAYDARGRRNLVVRPDLKEIHSEYLPTGELWRTHGAGTYPVKYGYDSQGRMISMTTWREFHGFEEPESNSNAGAALTEWVYHLDRGWLDRKIHHDGKKVHYTYTDAGRLRTRAWEREVPGTSEKVTTTYEYTDAGDLWKTLYNDATPDVILTRDRLGRIREVEDAAGTRTFVFNMRGQVTDEIFQAGSLFGTHRLKRNFHSITGRLTSLQWRDASENVLEAHNYGFGIHGQINWVTAGDYTHYFSYGHLAGARRKDHAWIYDSGFATVWERFYQYDKLGRTTHIGTYGASVGHAYGYNDLGQRTVSSMASQLIPQTYREYDYDDLGQLTEAVTKWHSDDTLVEGRQFGYSFDHIGNRVSTTLNSRQAGYTPDPDGLNQYAEREVPGAADVAGFAGDAAHDIEVNGVPAQHRKDRYFYHELTLDNNNEDVWETVTVEEWDGQTLVDQAAGNVFLAEDPEKFVYDEDGNLTKDGRWLYTWDADEARQRGDGAPEACPEGGMNRVPHGRDIPQNRLISMEARADLKSGLPRWKYQFTYDYMGRRVQKTSHSWDDAQVWNNDADERFVYDGWNLIVELDGWQLSLTRSYVWGEDLSGTMQGAGGVGGLLTVRVHPFSGPVEDYQVVSDANGNVTALIGMTPGTGSAEYDEARQRGDGEFRTCGASPEDHCDRVPLGRAQWQYDPFGNLIRASGEAAHVNPFRFSTKYHDEETGLYYYGYRYYSPSMGRWLNRDPIEEMGGLNLYGFVGNDGVNYLDVDGRLPWCCYGWLGIKAWQLHDLIFGDTCAGKTGSDLIHCILNGLMDNCVAAAVATGIVDGLPPKEIIDEVRDCYEGWCFRTVRDAFEWPLLICCTMGLAAEYFPEPEQDLEPDYPSPISQFPFRSK